MNKAMSVSLSIALAGAIVGIAGILSLPAAMAAEPTAGAELAPEVWRWGLFSAALVTAVSALAAALAVYGVGSAAMGALAEKPELFGKLLIFVGLAEGIAIYGIIISVLILNKLG
jgi:V/A-type H+-transporting ATPase subunit K